jgi:hypothetical protein
VIGFAQRVIEYTDGLDQAGFEGNPMTYDATVRNLYAYHYRDAPDIAYWRDAVSGREVDIIVKSPAYLLPEAVYRREAAQIGATVKVARLRETTIPVEWSDPTYRSVGHLVPDIVLHRGSEAHIVDAKYKSHLADLDERRWHEFSEDALQAHRADLHQVLAYSSLFDATEIRCTLVYPVSRDTWQSLKSRGRDVARAALVHGGRKIELELRGLPFGGIADEQRREYVVV